MIKIIAMTLLLNLIAFCAHGESETAEWTKQYCDISDELFFCELINNRHSGEDFDPSKPIPERLIIQLANAARFSPSSYNDQPWRFIFCDKQATPESYEKALKTMAESNQEWAKNAPLLIIVAANTKLTRNQKPNRWGIYDTGAASISLCYMATSLGLMTHQVGGFNQNQIQEAFAIPADFIPIAIIVTGYEAPCETRCIQEKTRKPLNEHFFLGEWGHGIDADNP